MPVSGELVRRVSDHGTIIISGPTQVVTYRSSPEAVGSTDGDETAASHKLYDDVRYTFRVFSKEQVPLHLNGRAVPLDWIELEDGWNGVGQHSFRQVGSVEVLLNEQPTGLRLRVASRKLDYETDYAEMLRDLEDQVRGLTAQMTAHALGVAHLLQGSTDAFSHWIAILLHIWRQLEHDSRAAWRTLPPSLILEERVVDIACLRRQAAHEVRALAASGNPRISTKVRRWEPLTPERQYVVDLLQYLAQRLAVVPSDDLRLTKLRREVERLTGALHPDVRRTRAVPPPIPQTPLAQTHPALRRVIYWHRLLNRGLLPDAGTIAIAMKDVNLLYEFWCYLTIVRLLVEESGGQLVVAPRVSHDPQNIVLRSGHKPGARVITGVGTHIDVYYEPEFRTPTVAQKPDNVVRLSGQRTIVFDAKYRFEGDQRRLAAYGEGLPIPPVDSLNQMHQYRDAIVELDNGRALRIVGQAIVLFPLPRQHHESFTRHAFAKSITTLGVGALPLLPKREEGLRQLIREYLEHEAACTDSHGRR
jgi:hypothetical protein